MIDPFREMRYLMSGLVCCTLFLAVVWWLYPVEAITPEPVIVDPLQIPDPIYSITESGGEGTLETLEMRVTNLEIVQREIVTVLREMTNSIVEMERE